MDANTGIDPTQFAALQQQFLEFVKQMSLQQQNGDSNLPNPDSQKINKDQKKKTPKSSEEPETPATPQNPKESKTKILLFNLKEPFNDVEDWKAKDLENVNEIFDAMGVTFPKIVKVFRLGTFRPNGRPRKVLIEFSNETDQQKVLTSSKKLKKDNKWKEVKIQAFRLKETKNEVSKSVEKCETESEEEEEFEASKPKSNISKKKTKPDEPVNPFINFASSDENSRIFPEHRNILVIGETGVGKSTWINGIANYMSFNTFNDAINAKPPACMIPMNFNLYVGEKFEKVSINMKPNVGVRDDNEAEASSGQSCTQEPKVYQYATDTVIFSFIDTPGIGDTRGVEYDMENMKMVLKCISKWDKIHGICLLLKPNESRLKPSLKYCIEELLVNLHKESIPNISVIFTNSCNTLFKPGDTMTVLKKLFADVGNISKNFINLSSLNTFCIDNEAVKMLYAEHKNINLEKAYVINFSKSWSHTVEETYRLFDYIKDLTPHMANETKATYQIRQIFNELTKVLAEINGNILRYQKIFDQQTGHSVALKKKIADKQNTSSFNAEFIQKTPVTYRITVCNGPNCIETIRNAQTGVSETFYKHQCCPQCPEQGVTEGQIGHPSLRRCQAFNSASNCTICGCSWQTHLHISYLQEKQMQNFAAPVNQQEIDLLQTQIEAKQTNLIQTKAHIQQLKQQYDIILEVCRPYFEFLRSNSIIALNSAFEEYLIFSIDEYEKTLKPEEDRIQIESLQKLLAIHQQQKAFVNCEDILAQRAANSSSQRITFSNYISKISSLKDHPILGPKLADSETYQKLFDVSEFKIVKIYPKIKFALPEKEKESKTEKHISEPLPAKKKHRKKVSKPKSLDENNKINDDEISTTTTSQNLFNSFNDALSSSLCQLGEFVLSYL